MNSTGAYAQLLLTLPAELRDSENAIELKRATKELVNELASLGLSLAVLQELLEPVGGQPKAHKFKDTCGLRQLLELQSSIPKLVYEFSFDSDINPHLRLWARPCHESSHHTNGLFGFNCKSELRRNAGNSMDPSESMMEACINLLSSRPVQTQDNGDIDHDHSPNPGTRTLEFPHSRDHVVPATEEIIISLVSDPALFQLTLSPDIRTLSAHLLAVRSRFIATLEDISKSISLTARPMSSTSPFLFHSRSVCDQISRTSILRTRTSDLYAWREIFRMNVSYIDAKQISDIRTLEIYVEAEIFESISEKSRGGRSIEDSEKRLQWFREKLTQRGISRYIGRKRTLKMKQSQTAFRAFLELNTFILNLKKFQYASAEVARKLLQKYAKCTSASVGNARSFTPSPHTLMAQFSVDFFLIHETIISPPRILIQAIGETLLPLIPHLDDYACLICTSIAFTPIRLSCGHFFCVRCLVKMQKRGQGDCPMCRAPVVLIADRSNVDWALRNLMRDWFPVEAKVKRRHNEREAAEEQLREMGFGDRACVIA